MTNELMNTKTGDAQATMSSKEIADLVESRHDDVKRSIERLATRGVIAQPPMADGIRASNGVVEKLYMVTKRDSYVVVAQLCPEFTARLVDRWQELEAKHAPQALPDYATALRQLADGLDRIKEQEQAIAIAAPKVEFVDKYVASTGSKGFRQVCKLLSAKEPEFRAFLIDNDILYLLGGEWTPHAQHLDAGRFVTKTGTSDVSGHAYTSARFTPKGVQWIAGEWGKHRAALAQGEPTPGVTVTSKSSIRMR